MDPLAGEKTVETQSVGGNGSGLSGHANLLKSARGIMDPNGPFVKRKKYYI
jgi:hypothetical protein